MKYSVELDEMVTNNLTIEEHFTLTSLADRSYKLLIETSHYYHLALDSLFAKGFILTDPQLAGLSTLVISDNGLAAIGRVKPVNIDFAQFIDEYPLKTPSGRRLKPVSETSSDYSKLKEKYLKKVRTSSAHNKAIAGLIALVADARRRNSLEYMSGLEVVINNKRWESFYDQPKTKDSGLGYGHKLI
jgi:hypothetical protein